MKNHLLASIATLAAASTAFAAGDPLVSANNHHGYALTAALGGDALAKNPNQNLFLSPASSAMALEMLLNGAGKGSATFSELDKSLHLDGMPLEAVNAQNRALLEKLRNPPPVESAIEQGAIPLTLEIANSAWTSNRRPFQFNPAFLDSLSLNYAAEGRVVNFADASGVDAINGWAADKTHGKIDHIIDADALKELDSVLMNATYFKANWAQPFSPDETQPELFTRGDGQRAMVPTMHKLDYGYAKVGDSEVMELPYAGGNASMYVVLPRADRTVLETLKAPEGPLSDRFWDDFERAEKSKADFSMPSFGFASSYDLIPALKTLGLATIFTPQADLSAMGNLPSKVDLVRQNTFVKVDETGTEAAAVTIIGAVAGAVGGPQPPIPVMHVDRPFLVSIVEKTTGLVLFEGVIANP